MANELTDSKNWDNILRNKPSIAGSVRRRPGLRTQHAQHRPASPLYKVVLAVVSLKRSLVLEMPRSILAMYSVTPASERSPGLWALLSLRPITISSNFRRSIAKMARLSSIASQRKLGGAGTLVSLSKPRRKSWSNCQRHFVHCGV
jgi:hypothetical protein